VEAKHVNSLKEVALESGRNLRGGGGGLFSRAGASERNAREKRVIKFISPPFYGIRRCSECARRQVEIVSRWARVRRSSAVATNELPLSLARSAGG
jgi:hypothetical protein